VLRLSAEGAELFLPEYKVYSETFLSPDSFLGYLKSHDFIPEAELDDLEPKLRKIDSLEKNVEVVYAYGKQEIPEGGAQFDPAKQYITALKLKWRMPSPRSAQKCAEGLGSFIKYSIEHKLLDDYVKTKYEDAYVHLREVESTLANLDFALQQNQQKLEDLKRIAGRSPQAGRTSSREVVSVEGGGYRYLPPSTQMAATDVEISDTRLTITDTRRDLKINTVQLEFFSFLKEGMRKGNQEALFDFLNRLKDEFFKGKDLSREEFLIVRNEVFSDFSGFEHRFNDVMRFASPPTLPKKPVLAKRLVAGIAFIGGVFFFILLAFFVEFIRQGRRHAKIDV
jgi:hypothetical protein